MKKIKILKNLPPKRKKARKISKQKIKKIKKLLNEVKKSFI
jgi:hypothetical protein